MVHILSKQKTHTPISTNPNPLNVLKLKAVEASRMSWFDFTYVEINNDFVRKYTFRKLTGNFLGIPLINLFFKNYFNFALTTCTCMYDTMVVNI